MEKPLDFLRRPLNNLTCPYCYAALASEPSDKEHVVGRRFVPKGTLNQSLNVILGAHKSCNRRKADLEDDLSAISMFPDLTRGFEGMGTAIPLVARRKAESSVSRLTRKPVASSSEEHTIKGRPFPGMTFSASFTSPPQMDEARVYELAHYHLRAFFYALTYNVETGLGGFWPEHGYFPVAFSRRADWGNSINKWFTARVKEWHPRFIGHFADEHFRVAIRRNPETELWSFAFEWNRTTRIIGFFGQEIPAMALAEEIPDLEMIVMGSTTDGGIIRGRSEVPLLEHEDVLFEMPDCLSEQPAY
jgi:hypothetical protein